MAFLRDEERATPAFQVPASVVLLLATLAAAHIARMLLPPEAAEHTLVDYAFIPARAVHGALGGAGVAERLLPFVSYIFVHGDLAHLAMNCLWLLAFGPIVARRLGPVLFLLFFFVCGAAAAATYLAVSAQSQVAVIGASGAISGLMAAGIRMLPVPISPRQGIGGALAPIFSRQVLVFSFLWVAVNLVFGPTGLTIGGETSQLAWQAHLGGYFAGLLLTGWFDRLAAWLWPRSPA
jgi:membrane associated rhomboid family serine protease